MDPSSSHPEVYDPPESTGFAMVERDEALERLEAGLLAARRERGAMILIEGEAGVGKTTLLNAFLARHVGSARILRGACENFSVPEVLGAVRDIARQSGGRLAVRTSRVADTFEDLLSFLSHGAGPAILVIEDIHWADDATLDLLRFLARRLQGRPVLAVVTARTDEVDSRDRTARLWASIPPTTYQRIQLEPLSLRGLERLVGPRDAARVHRLTGGNPFYLTEYLAAGSGGVPSIVQDATLARLAAFDAPARTALLCSAIFPGRIHETILRDLLGDQSHDAVEACLVSGMLQQGADGLRFRHELARMAVERSMTPLRRQELHAFVLSRLKAERDPRLSELLHHAEFAGSPDEFVQLARQAAAEASDLGAYREAAAHLGKALDCAAQLSDADRAAMIESWLEAAESSGQSALVAASLEASLPFRRAGNDPVRLGDALRIAAQGYWQVANIERAQALSTEALALLEGAPESRELAGALALACLLDMMAGDGRLALDRGLRAVSIASRNQYLDVYVHATASIGIVYCVRDPAEGLRILASGADEAVRLGLDDKLPGIYARMIYALVLVRDFAAAQARYPVGLEACRARDRFAQEAFIAGAMALMQVDQGRLREAIAACGELMTRDPSAGTMLMPALVALAKARNRLGLDADPGVTSLRTAMPGKPDFLLHLPMAVCDLEAAWFTGAPDAAAERLSAIVAELLEAWGESWLLGDALFWLKAAGRPYAASDALLAALPEQCRLFLEGRWRESAEAWERLGCPYERAVALAHGDEAARRAALAIFDDLGAAPAAQKLRRDLRAEGVRTVPAGPSRARRTHPAGLSHRQAEVLELLAAGLTNPLIGERLGLSAKTVEHHVSAVLAALEAPNRMQAVHIARERGLLKP